MFQRILVPIDGSPTAQRGLREAIALAAAQQARLLVLHVVDEYAFLLDVPSAEVFDELLKTMRRQGLELLAQARQQAEAAGVHAEELRREVTRERVADVIVAQAQQHHADLVVIGTHGRRGVNRLALGSDAELVLRQCPVPVLLVRS